MVERFQVSTQNFGSISGMRFCETLVSTLFSYPGLQAGGYRNAPLTGLQPETKPNHSVFRAEARYETCGNHAPRPEGRGKCSINFLALFILAVMFPACEKDVAYKPVKSSGYVAFSVSHDVDGAALIRNELVYTNAAGNRYMVSGLKYFLSEITFYKDGGTKVQISGTREIFYVDEDIPSTKKMCFTDKIPTGSYDSVSFIFGIPAAKNKSHLFINPPEVLMGWPDVLGGGYHFMMLDGKWKDPAGNLQPFNLHLGTGQLYKGTGYNVDSIYAFVDNSFRVSLPYSDFSVKENDTARLVLTMNIENWFRHPNIFNFDTWGGAIMQNQPAMQAVKENGRDVFSISTTR